MSKYSDTCRLCSNPSLSDTLLKAEACVYRGNPTNYAALETHLEPVLLPSVLSTGFMGGVCRSTPCTAGDCTVATLLAVCNSVKNLSYMVHMVREGDFDCNELAEITSLCMGGKECVVVSVSVADEHGHASFEVVSSSSHGGIKVDEASAMKILLRTTSAFEGAVWYWSTSLLGYSYILSADVKSMWIANVGMQKLEDWEHNAGIMAPSPKNQSIRVLPFFYSGAETRKIVMMGVGGATGLCKADLMVEMSALSKTVVDRAYCCTVSTGRCFCCQYIDTIHSTVHSNVEHKTDVTYNLKLSKQFRQKVKERT